MKNKKPARLSPAQLAVLAAMASGYKLKSAVTIDGFSWLQAPDGTSFRGDRVSGATLSVLVREKMVTQLYKFPISTYELTALGRATVERAAQ